MIEIEAMAVEKHNVKLVLLVLLSGHRLYLAWQLDHTVHFFCAIAIPVATSFATLGPSICITPQLMYKLGQAASESCNNQNHGKQKCVGNEGFITCLYSNSIVQYMNLFIHFYLVT